MPVAMTRTLILSCGLTSTACLLAGFTAGCQRQKSGAEPTPTVAVVNPGTAKLYPVVIRQPPIPQGVLTGTLDAHGQPVSLKCFSCHSLRESNSNTSQSADLNEFHQALRTAHGQLTCINCHDAKDGYSSLKLADGRLLAFSESMTLCAQCHGPQFGDYQHGSHGGMSGYWDLTKGGRTRNHCLNCHDPHAPKYPQFSPAAGPRDRFHPAVSTGESHE